MKNAQNNFVAGVFTLVGIAGFVFIILTLSGASWFATRKAEYTVRFTLADGATGIKSGSAVRVGGQEAGKVLDVSYWPVGTGAEGKPPEFVDVTVALRRDLTLFKDASVLLELPLLGNVSSINVPAVGSAAAGVLGEGERITGRIAPPAFLQQAGFGDEQRKAVQNILADTKVVAEDLKQITGAISGKAGTTMENIAAAAADVRSVAGEAKTRVNEWTPRIDATVRNIESLSARAESTRVLLDEGLERAKSFIGSVQEALNANRSRIDSTIKNVDELTAKANTELYKTVQATLDDASRGLRAFASAGESASAIMTDLAPEARLSMANARLASDQLKLMMAELRRNPWRLLYQPGGKELERELVYDAARTYAQAVSDLRGVSASLEAVTASVSAPGRTASDADLARLADLHKTLEASFASYKRAEEKFLRIITNEP